MKKASVWVLISTGILVTAAAIATGLFSFFIWALALNGFMGQERAVNASMITFVVLAVLVALVSLSLGVLLTYYLSAKRGWNAVGSVLLSTLVFAAVCGGLQIGSVIVSAIVAEQMRTTR
jgi:hypothetical protein